MLDASGIIHVEGDNFLVAEDEMDILRFFSLDKANLCFTANNETIDFGHNESDFESLAYDATQQRYYCIGSHGADYSKRLLGFDLENNKAVNAREISFDARHLLNDAVNIEGLSVFGSQLFIGYRKPSQNKLALAVIFDSKSGSQQITRFDLEDRTFRDIVRINAKNYLILGGPERGKHYQKLPSRIFWWNGDLVSPQVKMCAINLDNFRAEGIAVRTNNDGSLDILVGSDESKNQSATVFRMLIITASDISSLVNNKHSPEELKIIY